MKKILTAVFIVLLVEGCAGAPEYQKPSTKLPSSWRELTQTDSVVVSREWWKGFGSKELDGLMEKALAGNNDLLAGIYRVEQSRASLKSVGASVLPELDASVGTNNTRTNSITSKTVSSNSLQSGISVSYELDLFGKNRAAIEAAAAQVSASEYDQEALKLVVMADVSKNYFSLINQKEKLVASEKMLENEKKILKIIEARVVAGADSEIEFTQQSREVSATESEIETLKKSVAVTENALSVLLGDVPQKMELSAKSLSDFTVPEINPETPSRILDKRPDVCAAEAALFEANANLWVARAALFPSFSLTSGWNISASAIGDPTATAMSLVSSISAPLFKGWSLEAGVDQATAREKELTESYRQIVLEALQEAEDSINAVKIAAKREKQLLDAKQQADKNYELYNKKYESGSIDYRSFLTAENSKLSADNAYIQARYERLEAVSILFKALGGGWN